MKHGYAILAFAAAVTAGVRAQSPEITSFSRNGVITWSNSVNTDARYSIEWASTPAGPWHSTWQSLKAIEAHTDTEFSSEVPMFYRVTMTTAPWPIGMVKVDAGSFEMGDHYNVGDTDEEPVHEVYVSGFHMDRYVVTNERMRRVMQWAYDQDLVTATSGTVMNAEGTVVELLDLDDDDMQMGFNNGVFTVHEGMGNFPCVEVTWHGALAYCNYRSDIEGLPRSINFTDWTCDFAAPGYRLPTEAEWEKASRGSLVAHYYPWPSFGGNFSDHINGSKANYSGSGDPYDEGTTSVGYYDGGQIPAGDDMANPLGIYDMAGNVREWCWDWYLADWYLQAEAQLPDTTGPATGSMRVHRGGMYGHDPVNLRCANRAAEAPTTGAGYAGFRCVRR